MTDSPSTQAERRVQEKFSNFPALALILLPAAILFAAVLLVWLPDRAELGSRSAALHFAPVRLDPAGFAPLRLVGAWRVSADDPRFGGISALAIDRASLVALSDSGVIIRFPKPGGARVTARIEELPAGPGDRRFKRNRDSEALLRDPSGRGWWVAFETHHQLWLYDHGFTRALRRVALKGQRWSDNAGIEAMAAAPRGLLLFPEKQRVVIGTDGARARSMPRTGIARLSDATSTGAGDLLAIERGFGAGGFANALVALEEGAGGYRAARRIPLRLGPLDNVEALAAEGTASGATRLWLMTDDNYQQPFRTLLILLEG